MKKDAFKEFHFATVDLDKEHQLARQLIGSRGVPQLIMYEKNEGQWERRFLSGSQSPEMVEAFIGQAQSIRLASSDNQLP